MSPTTHSYCSSAAPGMTPVAAWWQGVPRVVWCSGPWPGVYVHVRMYWSLLLALALALTDPIDLT